MTTYKLILFKGSNEVECYAESKPIRREHIIEAYDFLVSNWQKSPTKIPFRTPQDFEKVKGLGREDVTENILFDKKGCSGISCANIACIRTHDCQNPMTVAIFREPVKEEGEDTLWSEIINESRFYDGSPHGLVKLTEHLKQHFIIKRKNQPK